MNGTLNDYFFAMKCNTGTQFAPKKNSRLIFLYDFRPTLAILWHLYHDISRLVLITLSFPSSKCNT